MSAFYDQSNKKWSFSPKSEQALKPVSYPNTTYYLNVYETTSGNQNPRMGRGRTTYSANISTSRDPNADRSGQVTSPTEGDLWNRVGGDVQNIAGQGANSIPAVAEAMRNYVNNTAPSVRPQFESAKNNDRINREVIQPFNNEVRQYNAKLPTAQNIINTTKGGDYVAQRDALKKLGISGLEDNFKTYYLKEKLQQWDTKLGSKPLYGDFDSSYYKSQNPEIAAKYADAVAKDDVDIVNRYGENGYYLWHYTTQGKPAGQRGNAPEATSQASSYVEKKPTDKDIEDVRTRQLGLSTATQTDRILSIPDVKEEWEKAKSGDAYWKDLAKQNYLNPEKKDDFAALFRLSNRDSDKAIRLNFNVNTGYGITELEDAFNKAVGEKAIVDTKRFGALTQNVLKDTIEEMKKAKAKEAELDMLSGFDGFSEIMGINESLTNSILGDSGIGGILSFTSGDKASESLEKSLENITGVRNNVTYNWQKWFDDTLTKRYDKEVELGYAAGDAKDKIKIEADFAKKFITDYLKPRFDTSRSMDEFQEYLDVRQEEQNPFQTQDIVNAVSQIGKLRADKYLSDLKKVGDRYFDSEFYFNPTGNTAKQTDYTKQKEDVLSDWNKAKAGDSYWKQQAYRFGVDINNKADFAKMHFQVKGQGKGYDPAKDILTASNVSDIITKDILPALKEEALKQGSVFGQFVKPEEFANEMLKGIDPGDTKAYGDLLKRYGLEDFKGTTEELKSYIAETLRTGSAQKIREEIKYLNERGRTPTQKVLGLTYIERAEDAKVSVKPQTELYSIFQKAGFKGNEDDFYKDFFPDLNKDDQKLLGDAASGKSLKLFDIDMTDPYASLSTLDDLFGSEEKDDGKTETKTRSSNYFRLGLDDDDDEDPFSYKSKTGSDILGEFTSLFKGY